MKKAIFISLILLLASCKKDKQNPYIGNWYYDAIVDYDSSKTHLPKGIIEEEYSSNYNFEILNDSIMNYKSGFFYFIDNKVKSGEYGYTYLSSAYYLGSKTNYKIENSNIVFFNKTSNAWDTIMIRKKAKDTLIVLGKDKVSFRLINKPQTYFNSKDFDAIIVSRSPCFGSCPFNSTYIDRGGNFYFSGYNSNTQNGNFYSKLDKVAMSKLFNSFDKIDIFKLKDNYSSMATDGQTNMISFIKNGKIVKTVTSYIFCPTDLRQAFTKLSYAYQKVKINPDNKFIFGNNYVWFTYKSKKESFRLKDSEVFYLEIAFREGKKVNTSFMPKYKLDFNEMDEASGIKNIMTDGRYYKFIDKNNSAFTIDIGYNFIEKNPIIKQKRDY